MRIIEPQRKLKKRRRSKKLPLIFIALALLVVGAVYVYSRLPEETTATQQRPEEVPYQSKPEAEINPAAAKFKYYSGNDFLKLYESIAYPNTQVMQTLPVITGNAKADERIRTIALSRGYVLRSVPVASITKTGEPRVSTDDLLQEKAYNAWQSLKEAAKADGIPLQFSSGYRSVEMQRELFLGRLSASGVTYAQIANGSADAAVVSVLKQAALPGYSRHHTGYTMDLVCANGAQSFEVTTCFKWLSDNNYLNAKKHGWIPSYPDGTDNQGPEPEPWEYVWVGLGPLVEN
jgi:LAS superfamily LD-carboxypeptidase LdcB